MASYWKPCCILLLYWTVIIHGASVRSSSNSEGKGSSAIKTLSLISMPPIPEFPKLNSRPGGILPSILPPSAPESLQQVTQTQTFFPKTPIELPKLPQTEKNQDNSAPAIVEVIHNAPVISTQPETQSKGNASSVESGSKPAASPEKIQHHGGGSSEFPQIDMMPLQVMNILAALGSGGSLAQASKPEKDGAGHSTANAIGYATGDNATVTAFVSNQMAVQPQVVTITDTAQASASSSSNGTAFSQATLSSNGWTGQQWGPGWSFA